MRIAHTLFVLVFSIAFTTVHAAQTCRTGSLPASTPDNILLDNSDGTISDTESGLMWKRCMEGVSGDGCDTGAPSLFTWQEALEQASRVNSGAGFAGYQDWRLPNIKELLTIVEEQCYEPTINLNRFPHTPIAPAWSGSPLTSLPDLAWVVRFDYGYVTSIRRSDREGLVRLVRSDE